MLEVADRLIASIGQDCMDTLFWSIANFSPVGLKKKSLDKKTRGRIKKGLKNFFWAVKLQFTLHFTLALGYMFAHSFLMLIQATTLNVAFNNHNKVLLIIMMSNNFIEIKGSVFKRFEKNNLFQVCYIAIIKRNQAKETTFNIKISRSHVLMCENAFIYSGYFI